MQLCHTTKEICRGSSLSTRRWEILKLAEFGLSCVVYVRTACLKNKIHAIVSHYRGDLQRPFFEHTQVSAGIGWCRVVCIFYWSRSLSTCRWVLGLADVELSYILWLMILAGLWQPSKEFSFFLFLAYMLFINHSLAVLMAASRTKWRRWTSWKSKALWLA